MLMQKDPWSFQMKVHGFKICHMIRLQKWFKGEVNASTWLWLTPSMESPHF